MGLQSDARCAGWVNPHLKSGIWVHGYCACGLLRPGSRPRAVFLSHVEIELNCEPFTAFRGRSALGFHERHLNAANGTLRTDGTRICTIVN